MKNLFNFIDRDDKGEITLDQLSNFIIENSLNDELYYIKKIFEENEKNLKLYQNKIFKYNIT